MFNHHSISPCYLRAYICFTYEKLSLYNASIFLILASNFSKKKKDKCHEILVCFYIAQVCLTCQSFLSLVTLNYRNTFVHLYIGTIISIYTVFIAVYVISNMNNIYKFQDYWRIFTIVRAWIKTQSNKMYAFFNFVINS